MFSLQMPKRTEKRKHLTDDVPLAIFKRHGQAPMESSDREDDNLTYHPSDFQETNANQEEPESDHNVDSDYNQPSTSKRRSKTKQVRKYSKEMKEFKQFKR